MAVLVQPQARAIAELLQFFASSTRSSTIGMRQSGVRYDWAIVPDTNKGTGDGAEEQLLYESCFWECGVPSEPKCPVSWQTSETFVAIGLE